jgi:hypothetical protein
VTRLLAVTLLTSMFAGAVQQTDPSAVFESAYAGQDFELRADADSAEWRAAPRVTAFKDYFGAIVPGRPTEIRSRWTNAHLYLLFICPYDELVLKPDPDVTTETSRLWNWDVAEAYIGSDFEHIGRYKELQVSPRGEWVDLDIDRESPRTQLGARWNSGYTVRARIDETEKVWYGEMRIPFSALDARPPQAGREFRLGLYRLAGRDPDRIHILWRPTGQPNYHVPQAFGTLRLIR